MDEGGDQVRSDRRPVTVEVDQDVQELIDRSEITELVSRLGVWLDEKCPSIRR